MADCRNSKISSIYLSLKPASTNVSNRLLNPFTANEHQPWTNYVNNGNEYLITGVVVRFEHSSIPYLHLIIGNVQKFVRNHKNGFQEYKSHFH